MALPASTYVPLTSDNVATVAALNAAVANLFTESKDYVAVPLFFEDGIMVCGSTLTLPGYFAGLTWDSVPDGFLTDPSNMDVYMATIPADLGIRSVVPTKYGYDLVVLGKAPAAGDTVQLEFNSALNQPATHDSLITITTPDQIGTVDQFWPTELMGTFTAANGYQRTTITFGVTASQGTGFNVGQTLTLGIKVWNDEDPTSVTNTTLVWAEALRELQAGQTQQAICSFTVDVATTAGDGVRVQATAGLGIPIGALEDPLIVTIQGYPAIHGLRIN